MSAKHFIAIAKVLRYHKDNAGKSTYADMIADLARLFEYDNKRFKRDWFERDCGVKQEVK